ncbi:hypothetical protein EXIGLDRAFT_769085 [Exidia glandulosa HHB12029]|uniref:Uncharacterized protein n=1 Tax=Exidia glandulosa HHB12029 TaxID=1314781 RepID=A0A166AIW2_EXIGL|nr:hypothetical protein EXIGLDRAFT_769085 [Exidia glandulosa HHB12029]
MDPVSLLDRLLFAGGHDRLLLRAVRTEGGHALSPPNFDKGFPHSESEPRPRPAPFTDKQTFTVIHRVDERIFVGRNAPAPQMAPWPRLDAEPYSSHGAATVCPSVPWFVKDDPAPYAVDPFEGMGPPLRGLPARNIGQTHALWDDAWVTQAEHGYQLQPSVILRIEAWDSTLDRVCETLKLSIIRFAPPSNAESPDALREEWRIWATEVAGIRAHVAQRLVGHGQWKTFRNEHPDLWNRLHATGIFDGSLIGAWFADPIRERAYIAFLINLGLPAYYEWTRDMEKMENMLSLAPLPGHGFEYLTQSPGGSFSYRTQPERAAIEFDPRLKPHEKLAELQAARENAPTAPSSVPVVGPTARASAPASGPAFLWPPNSPRRHEQAPSAPSQPAPVRSLLDRIAPAGASRSLADRFNTPRNDMPSSQTPAPDSPVPSPTRKAWRSSGEGRAPSLKDRIRSPSPESPTTIHPRLPRFAGVLRDVPITANGWTDIKWWDTPPLRLTNPGLEYVFSPAQPSEPRLLIQGPAYALDYVKQCSSSAPFPDHLQLVVRLLAHHIAFNTGVVVSYPDPAQTASSHFVSPEMKCNKRMTYAVAYAHWKEHATVILNRPHGYRAARMAGGVLARVADALCPGKEFPISPTDEVLRYGCPDPITVDGVALHDDWLSADEQKVLLGYDWDSRSETPRLLLPHHTMWQKHAMSVWTPEHDRWFAERLRDIQEGRGGACFLANHGWSNALRVSERKFSEYLKLANL